MGQEQSQFPPKPLSDIVDYILSDGTPKKIVVLTGAGVSTASGIPDFRSPETGLYANLARLNLPYPEAVFTLDYFKDNPLPFYTLAKELYPGKYFPTISHAFIALLHQKGMLEMLFTQNIDCLDRQAGVPDEKIVEAHGSFATQRCVDCKTTFPDTLMVKAVENAEPPHCLNPDCNGLVKPDIVFFGEGLPSEFFAKRELIKDADLLIVMGTSLAVAPFSMLPDMVRDDSVPRVLFNRERVGNFGSSENDCIVLDDCDSGVRKLAEGLGWADELEALFLEVGGKVNANESARLKEARLNMSNDEILEAEIEKITEEVDEMLQISKNHTEEVKNELAKDAAKHDSSSAPSRSPAGNSSKEHAPVTHEIVKEELPVVALKLNADADIDVTLPQNKPDGTAEARASPSHI